jgi:sugar lactone lactonase YvrE
MAATPRLPLTSHELVIDSVEVGMVSSVAVDAEGLIYILQRGDEADPVIVTNAAGQVLRSWGRGMYEIPHKIRIDGNGHVWTVDANSSMVYEFDRLGKKLREIQIELPADPRGNFQGTTDIAFAPNGDFYISDGYQNARILRFSRDGERLGEWGSAGTGPGEFNLPHGIAIDPDGTVLVADRENLRIQWFDFEGRYLGEWNMNGKVFSLKWTNSGELWTGTQPADVPNGNEGALMRLDPVSGKVLGLVEAFGHSIEVTPRGELLTGARRSDPGVPLTIARGFVILFRPD